MQINPRLAIFSPVALLVITLCALPNLSHAGEFALNFQPLDATLGDNFYPDTRCNRPEGPNIGCSGSWSNSADTTPFLQELFQSGGVWYYHVIVGTPESGFVQEFVMKANGPTWEGGLGSASLGDGNCRLPVFGPGSWSGTDCNLWDPLGVSHDNDFTGNGSGNPKGVVMRMIIGGTWNDTTKTWTCNQSDSFCDEFLKDEFLLKPRISQTIHDGAMEGTVVLDMRNSSYDTSAITANMTNTFELGDSATGSAGDFDFATDAQIYNLNAGRYVFTGSGPTSAVSEPYIYYDGGFELDRDWSIFK
ncbi:MAG: hypothetical protein FD130_1256 [Halothiobacillaceae bacterium]|nr:MAG: hypothetical protein FD130_1256 [Halothiobacillaceae bacterium]